MVVVIFIKSSNIAKDSNSLTVEYYLILKISIFLGVDATLHNYLNTPLEFLKLLILFRLSLFFTLTLIFACLNLRESVDLLIEDFYAFVREKELLCATKTFLYLNFSVMKFRYPFIYLSVCRCIHVFATLTYEIHFVLFTIIIVNHFEVHFSILGLFLILSQLFIIISVETVQKIRKEILINKIDPKKDKNIASFRIILLLFFFLYAHILSLVVNYIIILFSS